METKGILAKLAELETQMKEIEEDGTEQHVAAIVLGRQLAVERLAHADHVADFCKRIADLEAHLAKAEALIKKINGLYSAAVAYSPQAYIRAISDMTESYLKEFPREIQAND